MAARTVFEPVMFSGDDDLVAQKLRFCAHFVRFVEADCPWSLFHEPFYRRLSMTFDHIAHVNRRGFYEKWFSSLARRVAFLEHTLTYRPVGNPAWTYSDAETLLIWWLRHETDAPARWRAAHATEVRAAELQQLAALLEKYPDDHPPITPPQQRTIWDDC